MNITLARDFIFDSHTIIEKLNCFGKDDAYGKDDNN
jgi:hypothetical protein